MTWLGCTPWLHNSSPRVRSEQMREDVSANGRLLIVGWGNPAAGDDSAGIEIVRRLSDLGAAGASCGLKLVQALGCWISFPSLMLSFLWTQ